jgi:hypothetical protein
MTTIPAKSVAELRQLYDQSKSAAVVLKALAGAGGFTLEWAKQMRAAFGLSLTQVSPIGGWAPDGTGELKDAQLDSFLVPAIESTRSIWSER